MKKGIVYRSTGSWYTVQSEGVFYECRIKGKLRLKGIKSTNPVAVGDWVYFEVDSHANANEGNITKIEERQNYIVRKSVNLSKQTHIIASNIDQVFLIVTLNNPPTFPAFIDRFLVTAEAYQIPAIILFNKIDTYSKLELEEITLLQKTYENIGYSTYLISAIQDEGIEKVKELMQDKVSMFSGHSGVGKSTLVNAISPSLDLKTAAISKQHQQGMHTTTFAEMFALSNGIKIIDTPGIKGFGVVDMLPEEIGNYFPEFYVRKSNCKFHNCIHVNEPNCAVIESVEKGEIAFSRYSSYTQMMEEDSPYRN
ncbi:ribosome small subunit-dependent GTPase A [Flavobacteriaceae bacterium]|nr:ribosome small subunit-dependent GTPase A [Flavobacteriaceae bacterium]MBT4313949.1 ribosome small subunit-dependent GTPase A [Flavobacteriaceae bacterium]MBT5091099.1 ribosome small subunit-dependent GTPase A [Flavobacteriaceae bacterium]MBT5282686.1 ribosome small subunit-dependent GTPase A [Flavobacteriaceae bacterium]MBT5446900.1 ribosome small subunit-dependent GTPase A [Flavobacteriaceae bacterium]